MQSLFISGFVAMLLAMHGECGLSGGHNAAQSVDVLANLQTMADEAAAYRTPTTTYPVYVNQPTQQPQPQPTEYYEDDTDEYVPNQTSRNDEFDWKLIKTTFDDNNGNTIISPFSIKLVLALLMEAAATDSATFNELKGVLPAINSIIDARDFYGKIFRSLKQSTEVLTIGTKIFLDHNIKTRQRYLAILKTQYDTEVDQLDFKNTNQVARTINDWCDQVTKGYIKDLVQQSDVEDAAMLIANALYFKGTWKYPFFPNQSIPLPFYRTPESSSQTTFMTRTGKFYYYESSSLDARFLRLPYSGRKFAMTIVLPNAKGGLNLLLDKMSNYIYHDQKWLMDERDVRVFIPKFEFNHTSPVKTALEKLGLKTIFTPDASFPNFGRGQGQPDSFFVSNILQKAGIQVNEKGTIAYAATEVSLVNKFGDVPVRDFVCDRPFMFTIEDETTGTLLFAGKLTNIVY